VSRSRYRLRLCSVRLKGRVSDGQNASQVAGAFITKCQGNTRGLVVETVQPPREGRGGRDGTFELDFFPGVSLPPALDQGTPEILRHVSLDNPSDPSAFIGYRANGVKTSIPLDSVNRKVRDKLVRELKDNAKQAPKTGKPK
jgi:hypothetical protein